MSEGTGEPRPRPGTTPYDELRAERDRLRWALADALGIIATLGGTDEDLARIMATLRPPASDT